MSSARRANQVIRHWNENASPSAGQGLAPAVFAAQKQCRKETTVLFRLRSFARGIHLAVFPARMGMKPFSCVAYVSIFHPDAYVTRKTAEILIRFGACSPLHKKRCRRATTRQTETYRTITSVPAAINTQPIKDLAVNLSCRNTKAKINVITTLNLSIGTTFDASPSCKAL